MVLRDTDLERLRSLPLFGDASAETFKILMGGALLQRFSAGALLLIEGDAVDFLYVLLDGSVALAGTWNDKETTLSVLEPVSTFVLDAVVLDTESLVSATTLERSEVLMISGDSLRATMRSDASFGFSVSQELAGGHRSLVRSIKNHKLRGGAERLANHLLVLRARHGGSNILTLPYEKRVLASLMGMSPENLSRAFATLTGYGVEVRGPMVEIKRPAALERLARPTPLIDNHLPVHEGAMGDAQRELLAPVAA